MCACVGGSLNAQELGDFLTEARSGNSTAQYNAAMCYLHGWGTEPNPARWLHFMRLSAENGESKAAEALRNHFLSFAPELAAYWAGEPSQLPYRYHYRSYDEGCYYGELRRGMRDGYGTFVWDEGIHLVSHWEDGKQYGMCRIVTPQQRIYGNFNDFSGSGVIILSPGHHFAGVEGATVYVGYIENGLPSGHGAFYDAEGRNIYFGPIENSLPCGPHTPSSANSYRWSHERLSSGDSWEGESMGGLRHGFGIYHWADGSWWCGFWAEGLRDGAGLYMRADGAIMTGIWSNDSLQE